MAKIFSEQLPGESLDEFAQRAVTTTPLERTRFGEDVDKFVRCLHSQAFRAPYSVKEVFKSGSLGKGTAVRNLADIDLVVYFNGLSSIEDLQRTRPILLVELEIKVLTLLGIWPVKRTRFFLSYDWQGHKVDILPAFDLRSQYGAPSGICEAMERSGSVQKAAQEFSVSLAPFQVLFVKLVPEYVKKVIRLAKLWNEENGVGLRSYSLELLTIYVWRRAAMLNLGTDYLFQEVIKLLANCDNIRVAFNDNYNSFTYTRYMATPYIMDPANPFMNTLDGVDARRVSDCARRVDSSTAASSSSVLSHSVPFCLREFLQFDVPSRPLHSANNNHIFENQMTSLGHRFSPYARPVWNSNPLSTPLSTRIVGASSTPSARALSTRIVGASSTPGAGALSTRIVGASSTPIAEALSTRIVGASSTLSAGALSTRIVGASSTLSAGALSTRIVGASSTPSAGAMSTPNAGGFSIFARRLFSSSS